MEKKHSILVCPIDKTGFQQTENTFKCEENHHYDVAKQGYLNLLLNQHKNSANPGDSKEMIVARQMFLGKNYYQPIAEQLSKLVMLLTEGDNKTILDAGCGEGYYLNYILKMCFANNKKQTSQLYGVDISKPAINACTKYNKNINWVVATNAALPFANNSIDILVCLFGFPVPEEFYRVLKQNGKIIVIEPNNQHLIELRQIIYDEIKSSNKIDKLTENGLFKPLKSEELSYQVSINNEDIKWLTLMTPHFFRANKSAREKLEVLSDMTITVDVISTIYGKIKKP